MARGTSQTDARTAEMNGPSVNWGCHCYPKISLPLSLIIILAFMQARSFLRHLVWRLLELFCDYLCTCDYNLALKLKLSWL